MTAIQHVMRRAGRCGPRTLPLDPLLTAVGGLPCQLARHLGVSVRSVHRWRRRGLTWAEADELAVRAGFHPSEVWADW